MNDDPTNLDKHRGLMAQKATELRRLTAQVEADQSALKARKEALEHMLTGVPAVGWPEAVAKARYLLGLLAESSEGADVRRRRLIAEVLEDFDRLLPAPHTDSD
ncbi:MAG TPA: hypothetical protein VIL09_03825 [Microvirga sp.]|jgi:hypothetical protein